MRIFIWEVDFVKKYCWDFRHLLAIGNQVLNCLHSDWKKLYCHTKLIYLRLLALAERLMDAKAKAEGQRLRWKGKKLKIKSIRFNV